MGKPMPPHRVLEKAIIRNATIIRDYSRFLLVHETTLRVNRGIMLWDMYLRGEPHVGAKVDVRVRHMIFDPDTPESRHVWDATVIGGLKGK
jgi:hypothetical protein